MSTLTTPSFRHILNALFSHLTTTLSHCNQRYVESALIEGSVLDAVYSRQKKDKTDFCVKMYSHFDFNGKLFVDMLSVLPPCNLCKETILYQREVGLDHSC